MIIEGSTAPDPANWTCQVGEHDRSALPPGSDSPMREAVRRAYLELTGTEPLYIFSGWGDHLPEPRRAVVEDRFPDPAVTLDELIRDNWHLSDAESVATILRRMPREAWLMLLDLVEHERRSEVAAIPSDQVDDDDDD